MGFTIHKDQPLQPKMSQMGIGLIRSQILKFSLLDKNASDWLSSSPFVEDFIKSILDIGAKFGYTDIKDQDVAMKDYGVEEEVITKIEQKVMMSIRDIISKDQWSVIINIYEDDDKQNYIFFDYSNVNQNILVKVKPVGKEVGQVDDIIDDMYKDYGINSENVLAIMTDRSLYKNQCTKIICYLNALSVFFTSNFSNYLKIKHDNLSSKLDNVSFKSSIIQFVDIVRACEVLVS